MIMGEFEEYTVRFLNTLISVNGLLIGLVLIFLGVVYSSSEIWFGILSRVWLLVIVASVLMLISIYLAFGAYHILTLMYRVKDPARRERLSLRLSRRVSLAKNLSILALAILVLIVIVLVLSMR